MVGCMLCSQVGRYGQLHPSTPSSAPALRPAAATYARRLPDHSSYLPEFRPGQNPSQSSRVQVDMTERRSEDSISPARPHTPRTLAVGRANGLGGLRPGKNDDRC